MIIFPAIDLLGGHCVRLYQGDFDAATHFDADPLEAARRWRDQGATWLHIIDLDGARNGHPVHLPIIAAIAREVGLPIQLGGGLRTAADVAEAFDAGIARAILGTAALNAALLAELMSQYGGLDEERPGPGASRIAVALDQHSARQDDAPSSTIRVDGWQRTAGDAATWIHRAIRAGVRSFLVTDISRDGTLAGANVDLVAATLADAQAALPAEQLLHASAPDGQVPIEVTIAGGVTTVDDIRALASAGAAGAVIGRALYDGRITLPMALVAARQEETDKPC